jgi:hypothetical protein
MAEKLILSTVFRLFRTELKALVLGDMRPEPDFSEVSVLESYDAFAVRGTARVRVLCALVKSLW